MSRSDNSSQKSQKSASSKEPSPAYEAIPEDIQLCWRFREPKTKTNRSLINRIKQKFSETDSQAASWSTWQEPLACHGDLAEKVQPLQGDDLDDRPIEIMMIGRPSASSEAMKDETTKPSGGPLLSPARKFSNGQDALDFLSSLLRTSHAGTSAQHGMSVGALPSARPSRVEPLTGSISGDDQLANALQTAQLLQPESRKCSARLSDDGKPLDKNDKKICPSKWGITLAQVDQYYSALPQQTQFSRGMTVREMVEKVIRPATCTHGRSVAIDYNIMNPVNIKWIVSHSWDENVVQFFEDVLNMYLGRKCSAVLRANDDDGIFICFLCIYQGTDEEINLQVSQDSDDIEKGSFAIVLKSVQEQKGAVWVISNDTVKDQGGLYSRMWCGWEAFRAKVEDVPIIIHPDRSTIEYLFGKPTGIGSFSLEHGSCGPPLNKSLVDIENQRSIKGFIEKTPGGWDAVDEKILTSMLNLSTESSTEALTHLLCHKSEKVRTEAAKALGDKDDGAIHAQKVAACFSCAPDVVARSLAKMGREGAHALVDVLFSEESLSDEAVKVAARTVAEVLEQRAQTSIRHLQRVRPSSQIQTTPLSNTPSGSFTSDA